VRASVVTVIDPTWYLYKLFFAANVDEVIRAFQCDGLRGIVRPIERWELIDGIGQGASSLGVFDIALTNPRAEVLYILIGEYASVRI
jgi:hypothetical protein